MILSNNILSLSKIFLLFLFLIATGTSQKNKFHSFNNIKQFADFLFCDKDYLRAIEEYEKYLAFIKNDSVEFKIAYGYLEMGDYQNALYKFSKITTSSVFYNASRMEKLKSYFLLQDSESFFTETDSILKSNSNYIQNTLKLKNSFLLWQDNLFEKNDFLSPFDPEEKIKMAEFYDWKKEPPYKNEIVAGILSSLVPGLGKIYTKNYGDGITAFLMTGIFAYLAYDNFRHDHDTRAWIFTALGVGFYTGNIYGSVAAAQIFNAKLNFDFSEGIQLFLEEKNYFIPEYGFCK